MGWAVPNAKPASPNVVSVPAVDQAEESAQRAEAAKQKVEAAHHKENQAKQKVMGAGKQLAKIAADELGITDAFDCVTKGDLGACGETVLNVATSLIGGGPLAKLAKKYAFHWGKAYELAKTIKRLANELYDGFKAWRTESKAAREAEQAAESCLIGGKHSFKPGTPVLLADGSSKPIEDVKPGDEVLSTDPQTDNTKPEAVAAAIVTPDDRQFTDLTLATDAKPAATLTSTQHHPFWDETTQRWTNASDLHVGDRVRAADGTFLTVQAVRNYETDPQEARDLSVAELHTYYVLAGTEPVLVHNCPAGGGEAQAAKRGRAEDLQPSEGATGDHTVFERDEDGKVVRYQTWIKNDRAPSGWQKGPRFRGTGGEHSGITPPIYYPKGGGRGVPGADVPESIPPGYLP